MPPRSNICIWHAWLSHEAKWIGLMNVGSRSGKAISLVKTKVKYWRFSVHVDTDIKLKLPLISENFFFIGERTGN